jgi:hypothetical protein
VLPGTYKVRLEADGKEFTQSLTVQMDPRSIATPAELNQQFVWAEKVYTSMVEANKLLESKPANAAALQSLARLLNGLLNALESADRMPTAQAISAYQETLQKLTPFLKEAKPAAKPSK